MRPIIYEDDEGAYDSDDLVALIKENGELTAKVEEKNAEIVEQTRFITKLCALLDHIEVEEDSELARGRFDIFKEHGTVEWGMPISGVKQ